MLTFYIHTCAGLRVLRRPLAARRRRRRPVGGARAVAQRVLAALGAAHRSARRPRQVDANLVAKGYAGLAVLLLVFFLNVFFTYYAPFIDNKRLDIHLFLEYLT